MRELLRLSSHLINCASYAAVFTVLGLLGTGQFSGRLWKREAVALKPWRCQTHMHPTMKTPFFKEPVLCLCRLRLGRTS